jgi:hypothetical protein
MTFAELEYDSHYSDMHDVLLTLMKEHFTDIRSGLQGDSWIWIGDGEVRVTIESFTSMKHRVKSDKPGPHVQRVLEVLQSRFRVRIWDPPEPEGHE